MAEAASKQGARARRARKAAALPLPRLTWLDVFSDLGRGVLDTLSSPWSALALTQVPRSDGHAVLVLPGFMSTDHPTWPLRTFLSSIGYRAYPWGLGINLGFSTQYHYDIEALVEHRLKEVFIESGDRKISLIGWSLGGVYAKALARRYPQLIRDVITMGSPLSGDAKDISVWRAYEWVTEMEFSDPEFMAKMRDLSRPLEGVPVTAFYCEKDGVVPAFNAQETPGPLVQNVEVPASHVGMGFDSFVFYLIAHRLAQSDADGWKPLDLAHLRLRFERERLPI
jgi:pimeloyl-ACP methyl ester carboxylesterase